ncbi:MAG: hypothetical protein AB7L36_07690 [Sphingomonadaceae bacterium]|jgi:hypothetical protein
MPLAVLEIEELLEVLTDRTNPSRVLDQFLLSDIWAKLPKIRERSSDAMPMSLSVHAWFRPPLAPILADATPFVTPALAPASPFKNHATVMSSAALRESPNCRCRLVEA